MTIGGNMQKSPPASVCCRKPAGSIFDESCDCGKKYTRVLLNCGKLRAGCRPDSECLHPARHDYLSRSGELLYAVRLENVFKGSELVCVPCRLDGKRCLADVDHFGAEEVCNFDDLVASFD